MEAVCKKCGESEYIYRVKEVTGWGWSAAKVEAHADGSVSATVEDHLQDIDWDRHDATESQWGCGQCGEEKWKLEDLVELKPPEDPIERAQKIPAPGQEVMDV